LAFTSRKKTGIKSAKQLNGATVWGRQGAITITGGSANIGPNEIYVAKGKGAAEAVQVPDRFKLTPEGTPAGQARNVAQAYTRFADSKTGERFDPDFDVAVTRHKLIDAIERSSEQGKAVRL